MVILMEKEMMELLDVILRSLVSLVTLFLVTKMIGKNKYPSSVSLTMSSAFQSVILPLNLP